MNMLLQLLLLERPAEVSKQKDKQKCDGRARRWRWRQRVWVTRDRGVDRKCREGNQPGRRASVDRIKALQADDGVPTGVECRQAYKWKGQSEMPATVHVQTVADSDALQRGGCGGKVGKAVASTIPLVRQAGGIFQLSKLIGRGYGQSRQRRRRRKKHD